MINEVRADGFRSLDNFVMAVRPGLNVLVGPNGGGKTNILALFSFLSSLVSDDDVGDAISSSGGVSKVFKKLQEGSFQKQLTVGVSATNVVRNPRQYLSPKYRSAIFGAGVTSIDYDWTCVIDASHGYDQALYSSQILKCRVNLETDGGVRRKAWDFELKVSAISGGTQFEENIHDQERSSLIHQWDEEDGDGSGNLFTIDDEEIPTINKVPIFYLYSNAEIIRYLGRDLRGGVTFNFDPSSCKKPDDSARSPSLERDGSGLASIVYGIQKSEYSYGPNFFSYQPSFDVNTNKNLQSYFRLINPSISAVNAKNDPFDNKITLYVSVQGRDEAPVEFPLEFASDGTVKWLAFNVALLTHRSGFSLEEPENFLHPEIQRHAVELVRTEMGDDEAAFVLVTTHSESLLNASRPDEIIIVSMEDGVTSSKRLHDPHLISEEIRETGFGLGYYYISGALHG